MQGCSPEQLWDIQIIKLDDMKYSDICKLFDTRIAKITMPLRVWQCRSNVRKAINEWMETGREPNLTVELENSKGDRLILSAQSLIHDYGMKPLDALLFIDWANRSEKDCAQALEALVHHSDFHSFPPITDEMWKRIDPAVLEEYDKLKKQKEEKLKKLEAKYQEIEDSEIYE